jgi:hypothetical protein
MKKCLIYILAKKFQDDQYSQKNSVFWGMMLYSPSKIIQSSGGARCLHLQGQRINQTRNQHEAGRKLGLPASAGFLLGLFFNPEDGGDTFLQMSVDSLHTTQHYIPDDRTLKTTAVRTLNPTQCSQYITMQ